MLTENVKLLTHLGVFRKQNAKILAQNAKVFSHFSKLCTHFGVFRKQNAKILAQNFKLLTNFRKSRKH
ncbi:MULTISPECIES: hypothetical protein [Nostocaceae]|uniref:hypothetical protein n=1 Tax=Nostocaceae TaxID=1162 RepID=UPI001689D949|nr:MULTISPECIES: hypothetical protein [Nostocaceae]MBD2475328.1 hypothetical protein [Anabaena sp. FACHB-83]